MGAFAKNAVLKRVVAPTFRSSRRAREKTADPSLPSGQALKVGGTKAAALHYITETKGVVRLDKPEGEHSSVPHVPDTVRETRVPGVDGGAVSRVAFRRQVSATRAVCAKERPYGSVRGAAGNRCPYRDIENYREEERRNHGSARGLERTVC
jgi:hypothetical protein